MTSLEVRDAVPCDSIDVAIVGSSTTLTGGDLQSLDFCDVQVSVPRMSDQALAIGSSVTVSLQTNAVSTPIEFPCHVTGRRFEHHRDIYDLEFSAICRDDQRLAFQLQRMLNRRAAVRVTPDNGHLIKVRMHGGGASSPYTGELLDLSMFGLGVSVPLEVDDGLCNIDCVELSFCLNSSKKPIQLTGNIRSRLLHGFARVRYGLEFIHEPAYERHEDRIRQYVLHRQGEIFDGLT